MQRRSIKDLVPYDPELLADYKYKIDANENGYDVPIKARKKIMNEINRTAFNRYPDPGSNRLKNIIAKKNGLKKENICIGNGSDELIHYLHQAFTDEGDTIVTQSPSFEMYAVMARANGAKPVVVPLDDKFDIDEKTILKAAKNAKLIFFAYPNNPTGNCFTYDKILGVIKKAPCFVVVDEAYFEFSGKTFLPVLKQHKNLIILRTFSKAYSLASMRLGYMMADPEIISIINKVRLPYNVNSVSQAVGAVMAEEDIAPVIKKIVSEREKVYSFLKTRYPVMKSDANFLLLKVKDGVRTKKIFEKSGISIRMFKEGRLKDFIRITIGTPVENLAVIEILKRGV
jgi:histidinol-phosphate aminotransferase